MRNVNPFHSSLVPQLLSFCVLLATLGCRERAAVPVEIPADGPITIAVTGDTLITRPIEVGDDPAFDAVRAIVSDATLAFTNLDLNLLGPDEAAQAARNLLNPLNNSRPAPLWPFGSPREARTLQDLGIDIVSLANDHAIDYGAEGMMATSRALEAAGLLHAGTGADLAAARAPLYIGRSGSSRTPQGNVASDFSRTTDLARVAVIAVATSSTPESRATASRPDIQGRPGLNPLRYVADITVDPATFETLKDAVVALDNSKRAPAPELPASAKASPGPLGPTHVGPVLRPGVVGDRELTMFGTLIKKGQRTTVTFAIDERDERAILDQIKTARANAEVVLVSVHSHEPTNASRAPADFFQRFARAAIDAGAHAVVGHGPHRLRGVETYKSGVILYSLGNFLYQTDDLDFRAAGVFDAGTDLYALALGALTDSKKGSDPNVPDNDWWQGAVGMLSFENGRVTAIRLHPIHLGTAERGIPRLADPQKGSGILKELLDLSRPYGTIIRIDENVGTVEVRGPS